MAAGHEVVSGVALAVEQLVGHAVAVEDGRVGAGFGELVFRARVVLDAPVDGVWASDHYAVCAEIEALPR